MFPENIYLKDFKNILLIGFCYNINTLWVFEILQKNYIVKIVKNYIFSCLLFLLYISKC